MRGRAVIPIAEAVEIIRQEAHRWGLRYDEAEDRRQDGWVILLENNPNTPPLARTIIRRRLHNRERDQRTRKRGAGFAFGRMDAGWEDSVGVFPGDEIIDGIAQKQLLLALDFRAPQGSRQAVHQSIQRARSRWERLRRPHDT